MEKQPEVDFSKGNVGVNTASGLDVHIVLEITFALFCIK